MRSTSADQRNTARAPARTCFVVVTTIFQIEAPVARRLVLSNGLALDMQLTRKTAISTG